MIRRFFTMAVCAITLASSSFAFSASPALAQLSPCVTPAGGPCASAPNQLTEIAKEVEMIQKATQQIQTDENILTNAQSQLQELQAAGATLTSGQWTGVQGIIGKIQQLNTISNDAAQLDGQIQSHFHSDFPNYTPGQSYQSQFANWTQTTTQAEAQALSIASESDANSGNVNQQLTNISNSTPSGETQAIERLSQIDMILTQQVNRLLNLQSASLKTMSYYYQREQQRQIAECMQVSTQNPFAALGSFASSSNTVVAKDCTHQ